MIAAGYLLNFMGEFWIAEQTYLSEFMFLLVVFGDLLAWGDAFGEDWHAGDVAVDQVLGARTAAEGYSHLFLLVVYIWLWLSISISISIAEDITN